MIQPIIKGIVFSKNTVQKSFTNRTTGQSESYLQHSVDIICHNPRGAATVKVYSDDDDLDRLVVDTEYSILLTSFKIESGIPVFVAHVSDFIASKVNK